MVPSFVVLVVCHANVCRSPLAATLLTRSLEAAGLGDSVTVRSAGTHASPGQRPCVAAGRWAGSAVDDAQSVGAVAVDEEMLADADLVLVADRATRADCALLSPEVRPRMFTLPQAAIVARTLTPRIQAGGRPAGAPTLPEDLHGRLVWLVGEMDAARIHLAGRDEQADDIVDGHGEQPHPAVFEEVDRSVADVSVLLEACAAQ